MLKDKRILVTGGAGFIGSHLCEAFAGEGPKGLVAVDNLFLGKKINLSAARKLYPGLKFYKVNVADYAKMKKIVVDNKTDVVFNLAVVPLPASLVKPEMVVRENISTVLTLCELARQGYFKTLVHSSSSETYGTAQYVPMDESHPYVPSTPYAASKVAGDQLCLSYAKTYGVDLSILRPFNNYGPRQNEGMYAGIIPIVIKRILCGKPVEIYGDGEQTRDYIFVKDTARAFIKIYGAGSARNKIINIASGKEISVNDLVRYIVRLMGVKGVKIRHIRPRPSDVRRHCGGVKLAKEIIGFKPGVDFEKGLKMTIDWYVRTLK